MSCPGGKDTLVSPESVLRLARKLKPPGHEVLLLHRDEGGHATNYEAAMASLEFIIQKAGTKSAIREPVGRK